MRRRFHDIVLAIEAMLEVLRKVIVQSVLLLFLVFASVTVIAEMYDRCKISIRMVFCEAIQPIQFDRNLF